MFNKQNIATGASKQAIYECCGVENYEITFDPVKARYVKVVIKRSPALPKGHAGEGKAAYMFIDEIEVD